MPGFTSVLIDVTLNGDRMKETTEYEVQLHEAGPDLKAGIKSLFNYMQSTADRHSKNLGTSVSIMTEKNLTWVYSRFYAVIERYPDLYEKIRCQTWRSDVINGFVCREFIITASDGSILVNATSSLALIDRTTRKPVPVPELIISQLEHEKDRSIVFPGDIVEPEEEFSYIYSMRTRYDDIDINGHMNNASYSGIFFESIYEKLEVPMAMKSIDILFRGEIHYGDELECGVISQPGNNGKFYHRLFNNTKGRVSARAVTMWEIK